VSRYEKGKTNLDFTEARDSECSGISWAICKSAHCSRQITTPAPHHSVFTGRMPFLPPNQQRQSTEGIQYSVMREKKENVSLRLRQAAEWRVGRKRRRRWVSRAVDDDPETRHATSAATTSTTRHTSPRPTYRTQQTAHHRHINPNSVTQRLFQCI